MFLIFGYKLLNIPIFVSKNSKTRNSKKILSQAKILYSSSIKLHVKIKTLSEKTSTNRIGFLFYDRD